MDDLAARTSTMAKFIRAHKDKCEAIEYGGLGYSNGANIIASVMLSHPELFDEADLDASACSVEAGAANSALPASAL